MRNLISKVITNKVRLRKFYGHLITFRGGEHLNLFFGKKYEPEVWENLADRLKLAKHCLILDVGANIGQSMLALSHNFPESKIISFEPQKKEFEFLETNRKLNNIRGESFNAALVSRASDRDLDFLVDDLTGGRQSQLVPRVEHSSKEIDFLNIEDFLVEDVGLIKVDIEGFEEQLFKAATNLFSSINLLIEVREDTSEFIISKFFDTHDIYDLSRENYQITEIKAINFTNLLLKPKSKEFK